MICTAMDRPKNHNQGAWYEPSEEEIYKLAHEIRTRGYVDRDGVRQPPWKEFRRKDRDNDQLEDRKNDEQ